MALSEVNLKIVVCFALTTAVLVVCFTLIAVYSGFEHEPKRFRTIFLTMIFTVLFQMLIWEPLRFIVMAIDHATWPQEDNPYTAHSVEGPSQFSYLKSRLEVLRSELQTPEIHQDEALNRKYKRIARDLMLYGSYFVALLLVVLLGDDANLYYNRDIMERLFRDNTSITLGLSEIHYMYQIHDFLKITLIEAFHANRTVYGHNGWFAMEQWHRMGLVRLRQLRSDEQHIGLGMPVWTDTNYAPGWLLPYRRCHYADNYWVVFDPFRPIQVKLDFLEWLLLKFDHDGELLSYPELAGYEAVLLSTKPGALKQIEYLRRSKWLDRKTWVLFIDFTLYNADAHAFTMVTLRVENTPFGTQVPQVGVECVNVVESPIQFSRLELSVLALYIILVVQFIRELLMKLWYDPSVMHDVWNRVDLVICLLNLLILILWTLRDFLTHDILHKVKLATKGQYLQFQRPLRLHLILTVVKGFLVCITTLRLWKVLQFAPIFQHFTRTLSSAWRAVLSLGVIIVVLLMAIGIALTVPNGNNSVAFHHVIHAIITCLCYSTGFSLGITPSEFFHGGYIFGMLLYLLLVFLVAIILSNIFAAVIYDNFEATKRYVNEQQRGQRLSFLQFLRAEYADVLARCSCGSTLRSRYRRRNRTVAQNVALQLEEDENDKPKKLLTDQERHEDYLRRVRRTFCLLAVWEVQVELLERLLLGDELGNLPSPTESGSDSEDFPEMNSGDARP